MAEFTCDLLDWEGKACTYKASRKWNLDRHQRLKHRNKSANQPSWGDNITVKPMIETVINTSGPAPPTTSESPLLSPPSSSKRKWQFLSQDNQFKVPQYLIKKSCRKNQVRAVDWLTVEGKIDLNATVMVHLEKWGREQSNSSSPCLLIPADWDALRPQDALILFAPERCPLGNSKRLMYHLGDHSAAITRAIAWFLSGDWPRRGVDLDILLGYGPYEPVDGSHLCHHEACIVPDHICWESNEQNLSRQQCHRLACNLRAEGENVHATCNRHEPPCLLQHAALSTLETYLIQLDIFRQASGNNFDPPSKPRHHRYSTFETALPLRFCRPASISTAYKALDIRQQGLRPSFVCSFCLRIKSFKTVVNYWTHLFWKHGSGWPVKTERAREADLVEDIRLSARRWKGYYEELPEYKPKKGDPTMLKIAQALHDGFTWRTVENWGFRR